MTEEVKKDVVVEEEVKIEEPKTVDVPVEKDERKYTDDDLNKIIDSKFARWQEEKQKEIDEAQKLSEMNATEKAEHERNKLKEELEELRAAKTKTEMTNTARGMLKEKDITIDDSLINILVDSDADKTKNNIDKFVTTFNDAVNKAVLETVKNPNDKRGTTSRVTKEEIMAIKDRTLRQQKIKENIGLFQK